MGRRGPQPQPTAIRLAKGERRPSQINYEEPELPAPAGLEPPNDLTGAGRKEWVRLAAVLTSSGVLTEADLGAFADLCRAMTDLRRYESKARRAGLEFAIAKGFAGMVVKLRAQVATLRGSLGLTPSSRTSVKATELVGRDGRSGLLGRFPKLKAAQFAYDPAFATEVALSLAQRHGLTTVEVLQNYKHLSEACQVFEALVKAKRVIHGGHRLLRWNLENVAVKTDDAGRIRPVKPRKSAKRIDGVVASIMAISRLMVMPPERKRRMVIKQWTPEGFVSA